jgi:hypothetical protein
MTALVEGWTKNSPAGSDTAVNVMKQAIASANSVYETSQKAVKHAVEITKTNLNNTTDSFEKNMSASNKSKGKSSKGK